MTELTSINTPITELTFNRSDIIKKQATINLGTIGYASHGKSTTVAQLTGTRTQRHSDEIEENRTIHLGYADFKIFQCVDTGEIIWTPPDVTHKISTKTGKPMNLIKHVSFVDCPGQAEFMCTMVSGTSAMDAALLLIGVNDPIFPQLQMIEHLAAIATTKVDNILILQNKLDLVTKEACLENKEDVKTYLAGSPAGNSLIIPISAQLGQNMEAVANYIAYNIPDKHHDTNKPFKMYVIRSYDNNKPHVPYKKMIGGSIGGSISQGNIMVGDYIEIRPGFIYQQDNSYVCQPIVTKVTTLFCGKEKLDVGFPGGLISIGTEFDPSLSKLNGLVGQIAGRPGTLPKIYQKITFRYHSIYKESSSVVKKQAEQDHNLDMNTNFNPYSSKQTKERELRAKEHKAREDTAHKDKKLPKIKCGEDIIICVNAKTVSAVVSSVDSGKIITAELSYPVCIDPDVNIAVLRYANKNKNKLILHSAAELLSGVETPDVIYPDVYQDILKNLPNRQVIINEDVKPIAFNITEQLNYNKLLQNITFANSVSSISDTIQIKAPMVERKNRDSIVTNYNTLCSSFDRRGNLIDDTIATLTDLNLEIIDISEFLTNFIKTELNATGSVSGNGQLILRGAFENKHIKSVVVKFAERYTLCTNCGSHNTLVAKQKTNRILTIVCLRCQAKISIR
jgi:translation initiation factor 2 subunit 3